VVSSDAEGYHQYLTALFIHQDVFNQPYSYVLEDGRLFNKYNYGVALLQLPFFLVAHLVTLVFDFPASGNITAYVISVIIAGIFYTYLGLLFLFRLLRKKYDLKTTWITVILVFLGTNLVYYAYRDPGMSHAYAFFLIALFIYGVHRYYDDPGFRSGLVIASSLGILGLIRLPHLLIVVYLVLIRVSTWKDLRKNIHFLRNYWLPLLLIPFFLIALYIPQSLYWHALTGHYFVNPYDYSLVDEGFFNWNKPRIGLVLFGPVGGWLLLTPIMLFAIAGLLMQLWNFRGSPWAILIILTTTLYLYGSWWHPTLAGSFGHRGFTDIYPFLALPLAFIVHSILKSAKSVKYIMMGIWTLLIYINLQFSFMYQYWWWDVEWGWQGYLNTLAKAFFIQYGG
jgi:hypothetical protein